MKTQTCSRRDFLSASMAAAALGICSPRLFAAAAKAKIPIGLQLYSVRNDCAKDLPGVLNAVGRIGYKAVEFAGYYGRDAKSLRKLLDDAGLQCCGTHTALTTLLGDQLEKTVEFNQAVGNKFLIVPSLPEKYRKTKDDWRKTADIFSEVAAKVKGQGMIVGYHNHGVEFQKHDGELAWDIFFNRASKDVVIQYDVGNAAGAGADARDFLKKFPGRVASIHAKPFSKSNPDALIGKDELPWNEIFALCESTAGVQWYIVEYERRGQPPLESVGKLHKVLCDLGKC
jgi:sugar phosphate isomerase/epimerase